MTNENASLQLSLSYFPGSTVYWTAWKGPNHAVPPAYPMGKRGGPCLVQVANQRLAHSMLERFTKKKLNYYNLKSFRR